MIADKLDLNFVYRFGRRDLTGAILQQQLLALQPATRPERLEETPQPAPRQLVLVRLVRVPQELPATANCIL